MRRRQFDGRDVLRGHLQVEISNDLYRDHSQTKSVPKFNARGRVRTVRVERRPQIFQTSKNWTSYNWFHQKNPWVKLSPTRQRPQRRRHFRRNRPRNKRYVDAMRQEKIINQKNVRLYKRYGKINLQSRRYRARPRSQIKKCRYQIKRNSHQFHVRLRYVIKPGLNRNHAWRTNIKC